MPNGQMNEPKAWFALQVRSRWENATEGLLQKQRFRDIASDLSGDPALVGPFQIVESPLFSRLRFLSLRYP